MKRRTKAEEIRRKAKENRDPLLEKAILSWVSLSKEEQMAVLHEVVVTRGKELKLAYPDIMEIGYGIRTVTIRGKLQLLPDEMCIVFMVPRKWISEPKTKKTRDRHLPRHLMTYCSTPSGRQLCAIPTNIESGLHYKKVKPHDRQYVLIKKPGVPTQAGVFCCAVTTPGANIPFGLSCHHVLAMSKVTNPQGSPALGAQVFLNGAPTAFGTLSDYMGKLVPGPQVMSFDAALAEITDMDSLSIAIGGNPINFWDGSSIISQCFVQCPTTSSIPSIPPTGSVSATYVQTWPEFSQINYFCGSGPQPCQPGVIELHFNPASSPKEGDSGSPVVDGNGVLLGMYIAGSDDGTRGFMLPANVLMSGVNYGLSVDLSLSP